MTIFPGFLSRIPNAAVGEAILRAILDAAQKQKETK